MATRPATFLDLPYELRHMIYERADLVKPPSFCQCYCTRCRESGQHHTEPRSPHEWNWWSGYSTTHSLIEHPAVLVGAEGDVFDLHSFSSPYSRARLAREVERLKQTNDSTLGSEAFQRKLDLVKMYSRTELKLPQTAVQPALTRTSRLVRDETLNIFYGQTFQFAIFDRAADTERFISWLRALDAHIHRMRRLILVYRKKFWFKQDRKKLCTRLTQQGINVKPSLIEFQLLDRAYPFVICCQVDGRLGPERKI